MFCFGLFPQDISYREKINWFYSGVIYHVGDGT